MNFIKTLLLLIIAVGVFSFVGAAQTNDRIVVTDKFQFRQSDIDRLIEIYEWMLAGRFTAAPRSRFQTLIVKDAQSNEATAQGVQALLGNYEKIKAADEQKRETFQREMLPELIAEMEKVDSEINAVLLEVYRSGRNKTADAVTDEPPNAVGKLKISDLAGTRTTGSVSTERYRSLVSGELSDPSGTLLEYEISPDGTIKYAGYTSNSFYSCTVQMFVYKTGRISISGSNLVSDYARGSRTNIPCAAPKREAVIPVERKILPFRIERDEYGLRLCTTENEAEVCLRKAN